MMAPRTRRYWLYAGAAVGIAAVGGAAAWWGGARGGAAGVLPEDTLWAQQWTALDGSTLPMESLRGRPTVVNFWATWCPPCVHELPLLNAFHRSHHAQGWQVLGVAIDKAAAVQQFLRKLPLDYPVALAGPGGVGLTRALGNLPGGLPFTLVTAANGRILHRKIGQIQAPDLEHWAASMV